MQENSAFSERSWFDHKTLWTSPQTIGTRLTAEADSGLLLLCRKLKNKEIKEHLKPERVTERHQKQKRDREKIAAGGGRLRLTGCFGNMLINPHPLPSYPHMYILPGPSRGVCVSVCLDWMKLLIYLHKTCDEKQKKRWIKVWIKRWSDVEQLQCLHSCPEIIFIFLPL